MGMATGWLQWRSLGNKGCCEYHGHEQSDQQEVRKQPAKNVIEFAADLRELSCQGSGTAQRGFTSLSLAGEKRKIHVIFFDSR